jgi:putative membrane protein
MTRTGLANERTLLAYARTALAVVIIGGSCIKFFDGIGMTVLGVVVMGLGVIVGAFGGVRYRRVQREMAG